MHYILGGHESRLGTFLMHFFKEGSLSTLTFERDKKDHVSGFALSSTGFRVKDISRGEKVEALNLIGVSLKE